MNNPIIVFLIVIVGATVAHRIVEPKLRNKIKKIELELEKRKQQ